MKADLIIANNIIASVKSVSLEGAVSYLDQFNVLNKIRMSLHIGKGNNFFYNVIKQAEKRESSLTKKQLDAGINILMKTREFKRLLRMVHKLDKYDDAFKEYQKKSNNFMNKKGRGTVKARDMIFYTLLSEKPVYNLLKRLKP